MHKLHHLGKAATDQLITFVIPLGAHVGAHHVFGVWQACHVFARQVLLDLGPVGTIDAELVDGVLGQVGQRRQCFQVENVVPIRFAHQPQPRTAPARCLKQARIEQGHVLVGPGFIRPPSGRAIRAVADPVVTRLKIDAPDLERFGQPLDGLFVVASVLRFGGARRIGVMRFREPQLGEVRNVKCDRLIEDSPQLGVCPQPVGQIVAMLPFPIDASVGIDAHTR